MKSPWVWNRTRLCQLTGKKALHPVTFYAIQLSALSPRQKDFLAYLKSQITLVIYKTSKRKSSVPQRIPSPRNCEAAEEPILETTNEASNPGNEDVASVTRNLDYKKSDRLEALIAELAPELLETNQL